MVCVCVCVCVCEDRGGWGVVFGQDKAGSISLKRQQPLFENPEESRLLDMGGGGLFKRTPPPTIQRQEQAAWGGEWKSNELRL